MNIDKYLTGYCDKLCAQAGDVVRFMISGEGVDTAQLHLVRLIHGDENPGGPGFLAAEIDAPCNGSIPVSKQFTQTGSFVRVADPQGRCLPPGSFTVYAFVWSTTPTKGRQGILTQWQAGSQRGYGLGIDEQGRLAFWLGDGRRTIEITGDKILSARVWYFVAASYDADEACVALHQEPIINAYNSLVSPIVPREDSYQITHDIDVVPLSAHEDLLFAGFHNDSVVDGLYNGKIDRSGLHGRVLKGTELDNIRDGGAPPADALIAHWDTSAGYTRAGIGDTVVDVGPNRLNGQGYNRPVRAMTGYNWSGRELCFALAPEEYGGIYFNDDAIIDCRWTPSAEWYIPATLKSGVYAARLTAPGVEDYVTFFVRPKTPQAKIAMLMPTASYLAYANEHFVLDAPGVEVVTGHPLILADCDYLLAAHPEWGRSSYDHHADGAGVCYSSYRRPVMGLRPKHRMASTGVAWQFPADLSIICWLEQRGCDYDVITDEDLHREGVSCLAPYNVVLNGTHSEYYSEAMLDATEQYLADGGRVMYLGANGYYWAVAFREDEPWCMEIRKLDSGSRAWQAAPGEYYMATTGEMGGIWRNRGRPPQKIMGVGFTSEGMDESRPYRRLPDSYDPAVSWIFAGVENEVFGDFGLGLGGAAGLELDRYELSWGTPLQTYLLASSEGEHSDAYPHVSEEIMFNYPGLGGTQDFQVRADLALFHTTNGGAVFATGSIAWGQALPCNDGNNDIATITANVLEAMMRDGPLP